MIKLQIIFLLFHTISGMLPNQEKMEFCENLDCDDSVDEKVCGVRYEEDEVIFRLFDNECKLLQFGCQVDDRYTYGIIDMKHCVASAKMQTELEKNENVKFLTDCMECADDTNELVCGIRQDGNGFRIRIFDSECQLKIHNCYEETQFNLTDFFICANDQDLMDADEEENEIADEEIDPEMEPKKVFKSKNVVVVDGSMFDKRNINESIKNFFDTTHTLDLPLKDMHPVLNETTRKRMVNIFGPIQVFTPWIHIPKNISDDYYHRPTLSSCYHKCPTKCPDTYAPVCGVPGIIAREPSLMFQNHCYMDVAQCKMHWEGKSYTAESSSYIESSFMFCLGDEMHGLYRFLPLVRTLQHMGRLKLKGKFKYKFRNMRFFNNLLSREPKIMG